MNKTRLSDNMYGKLVIIPNHKFMIRFVIKLLDMFQDVLSLHENNSQHRNYHYKFTADGRFVLGISCGVHPAADRHNVSDFLFRLL